MIIETGAGLINADSYADPEEAAVVAYFASHLYPEAWTAATLERKQAAVIQATRLIDTYYVWQGFRLSGVQSLSWPRAGILIDGYSAAAFPNAIKLATAELALHLLKRDRVSDDPDAAAAAPLESIGLGDGALELKFGKEPASGSAQTSLFPPLVIAMLRLYGYRTNSRMVPIERR